MFFIFSNSAFAQYVDSEVVDIREQSFLNIKRMITGRKRVKLDTSNIRLPLKRGRDMEACYKAFLEKEKKEILHNIEEQFDVDIPQFIKSSDFKSECSALAGFSPKKNKRRGSLPKSKRLSPEMLKRGRETFALFHDKPEKILFIQESDGYSPAAANGNEISVDEKLMNFYDEDSQRALLAHEFVHYIEKHAEKQEMIKWLLRKKHGKLTRPMYRRLLELSRCDEATSDIKGALRGGEKYIEGYLKFAEKNIHIKNRQSHPQSDDRKRQAELRGKELRSLKDYECSSSQ